MKACDVVILGDGIAAYGVARELLSCGRRVVIAARTGVQGGASRHAAGILDPLLEMEPSSPLLTLNLEAFRAYLPWIRRLERRTGRRAGFLRTGLAYVAVSPSEAVRLRERFRWQKKLGIPARWLAPTPWGHAAGIHFPNCGRIEPAVLMRALEREFRNRGGKKIRFSGSVRLMLHHGVAAGLSLDDKSLPAGAVVDATGSWTDRAGLGSVRGIVRPLRGQILLLGGNKGPKTILHSLDGTYLVPWRRGVWLAGSTVENAGFRAAVTSSGIRSILKRVYRFAPEAKSMRVIRTWAGLRPGTRDGMPLIGEDSIAGLFHANGYYRSGILIGIHAGRLLARGMITGRMPGALRPFDPKRFTVTMRREP